MKRTAFWMVLALLAGCATRMETHVDHDVAQVFTAYHTYAWLGEDPQLNAGRSDYRVSPLNRRRVIDAVEAQLASKGFVKVPDRASADFVVAYTIGARDKLDITTFPAPYNGGWGWGRRYFGPEVDAQSYVEGTLAIDIFDRRSHRPVWHGWARKRVTEEDREHASEQIDAAVKMILNGFPPR